MERLMEPISSFLWVGLLQITKPKGEATFPKVGLESVIPWNNFLEHIAYFPHFFPGS